MATRRMGRRFGEEKGIQRNKDDEPGQRPKRSPGQSNANRPFPSLREDVGASQRADIGRIKRGYNPTARGGARTQQIEAGKRALSRIVSRAGLLGAAATAGYEVGTAIAKQMDDDSLSKVDARESYKNIVGTSGSKDNLPGFKVAESKPSATPKRAKAKEVSAYDLDPNAGAVREGPHSGISGETRKAAMEDVNKHKWKGSYDHDD